MKTPKWVCSKGWIRYSLSMQTRVKGRLQNARGAKIEMHFSVEDLSQTRGSDTQYVVHPASTCMAQKILLITSLCCNVQVAPVHAILASNTSSISITRLAKATSKPHRVVRFCITTLSISLCLSLWPAKRCAADLDFHSWSLGIAVLQRCGKKWLAQERRYGSAKALPFSNCQVALNFDNLETTHTHTHRQAGTPKCTGWHALHVTYCGDPACGIGKRLAHLVSKVCTPHGKRLAHLVAKG